MRRFVALLLFLALALTGSAKVQTGTARLGRGGSLQPVDTIGTELPGDPNSDKADTNAWTADSDARSADGGVAVAVVIPTDLAGLKVWLSDTGAAAGTWPDLSGNANDAVQATGGNQPSIVTGVVNGKQVRRFDGVDDKMAFGTSIPVSAFTIIAVVKCPGYASGFDAQYIVGNVSDAGLFFPSNGTVIKLGKSFEVDIATSGTITNNTWHIVSATYSSPNGTIFVDGALNATGASAQTFGNCTTIGKGAFSTNSLGADLAEIVIYNRALADDSTERRALEDYFGNKYGITVSH